MSLLILALGNDLLGDDGIGLLAADILEREKGKGVEVVRSALSGLYLVDLVEGFEDLIIVDSIVGDRPGKVVQLKLRDVGPVAVPSAHYAGLPEALELARRAGMAVPDRVAIIAMQIRDSQILGTGVSTEVKMGLPDLIEKVRSIAEQWGYKIGSSSAKQKRKRPKKR